MNTYIPEGYKSLLGVYDTQKAIGLLKRLFEDQLAAKLNLFRVSAPLFLEEASGLNDNLNGYERPVRQGGAGRPVARQVEAHGALPL